VIEYSPVDLNRLVAICPPSWRVTPSALASASSREAASALTATTPACAPRLVTSSNAGRTPRSASNARSKPRVDHDIGRLASFMTVLVAACNGVRRSAAGLPGASSASTVVSQSTVAAWAVINRDEKFFDVGPLCGDGQRLDVAGTIEQLVLERQVTRQRLLERFGLLGQGFDRRSGAAQDRSQHVGEPVAADRGLDTSVALPRRQLGPGRVPKELTRWLVGQALDVDIPHAGGRTAVTDTVPMLDRIGLAPTAAHGQRSGVLPAD